MTDKRELLILGGGLVGMTLALAAAKKGISSHVVDRADPAELTAEGFDGRASAISTASWNLFSNIGLGERLAPHGCPIDAIAVTDAMRPGRLDFRPEPHEGSLGLMFANRELRLALFEAAKEEPLIAWHAPADVIERQRGEHGVSAMLADGDGTPRQPDGRCRRAASRPPAMKPGWPSPIGTTGTARSSPG